MPGPDVIAEAVRLLEAAEHDGVPLRALGGVAIRLRTPHVPPALERDYHDIDLVTQRRRGGAVSRLLEGAGYRADQEFNALHGDRRLLFHDDEHARQIDVFVGAFTMCHEIPVAERLGLEPRTIPLAELLLTKLQIVEINDKDLRDTATVLLGHEVADRDGDAVNAGRVAALCAADWGLWRTSGLTLERLRAALPGLGLAAGERAVVDQRAGALWDSVEAAPKGMRWKLRARVGDRVRWYEEPEETGVA
jgi:Uncharacterised nucleotidyltransferase